MEAIDLAAYAEGPSLDRLILMARLARVRSDSRKRTVIYAVAAAVVVLFLVAGLVFVNSLSVSRVTENARALHWTNATMGNSALTRAGLVQAVTFAELTRAGMVDDADHEFAMDQVSSSIAELRDLFSIGGGHESYGDLERFVDAVSGAVAELEDGRIDAAKQSITTVVESAYLDLSESLASEQEKIQTAIEDNDEAGQALNGWVVFVLTLAVPGSAVAVYFVVARRQVRALKERNRLELEAERTISKAKDTFIAGLSHELRTPLTSIYGFAEVLADQAVTGPEATSETAQIIAKEAAEMARMVDDLLAASRLESTGVEVELSSIRLQDVVESAVMPFERASVEITRTASSAVAMTDAARLRHVLINLISNAVRHGGPTVGIEVTEGEDSVDVEVWDDGPGVRDEHVDRLFDRFVHDGAAPLLTGSIGLGLAVASRLADLMHGGLAYQRVGGKTYFVVTLPTSLEIGEPDQVDESVSAMTRALWP